MLNSTFVINIDFLNNLKTNQIQPTRKGKIMGVGCQIRETSFSLSIGKFVLISPSSKPKATPEIITVKAINLSQIPHKLHMLPSDSPKRPIRWRKLSLARRDVLLASLIGFICKSAWIMDIYQFMNRVAKLWIIIHQLDRTTSFLTILLREFVHNKPLTDCIRGRMGPV